MSQGSRNLNHGLQSKAIKELPEDLGPSIGFSILTVFAALESQLREYPVIGRFGRQLWYRRRLSLDGTPRGRLREYQFFRGALMGQASNKSQASTAQATHNRLSCSKTLRERTLVENADKHRFRISAATARP
jgi:hypothetical protein